MGYQQKEQQKPRCEVDSVCALRPREKAACHVGVCQKAKDA